MIINPGGFFNLGTVMTRRSRTDKELTNQRRFKSHFGTSPEVCAILWQMLPMVLDMTSIKSEYLLWGLLFMKVYATESIHCSIAGADGKTFRK